MPTPRQRLQNFKKLGLLDEAWCQMTEKEMLKEVSQHQGTCYLDDRYLIVEQVHYEGQVDELFAETAVDLAEVQAVLESFLIEEKVPRGHHVAKVYDLDQGCVVAFTINHKTVVFEEHA